MSELIYTFAIILGSSAITFLLTKKAMPDFLAKKEFNNWRLAWFVIVISAYIGRSAWLLYGVIFATCVFWVRPKPSDRTSLYLVLLCALPTLPVVIPGFGGINFLFTLVYPRMLALVLLLGLVLKNTNRPRLFSLNSDKYVTAFIGLTGYLTFRDHTLTDSLRSIFLDVMDIFVPYFVLSRRLDTKEQLDKACLALVVGLAPLAPIGCFESLKHWHVYDALSTTLVGHMISVYDVREGSLRAAAIFKSPIVLGYAMTIGLGLLFYLKPMVKNQQLITLAIFSFIACLLATMSRGPWVGLAFLGFVYMWTGREAMKKMFIWGFAGFAMLPLLSLSTFGNKFLALLPFIGSSQSETVDYRSRLFEQSWIVFKRHPWFGSTTFLETPEMQSMIQGQGIIDLVNSYISIGLPYGIVGLTLFLAIFASLLLRCYFILKRIPPAEADLLRMGRALFAIVASIMLMIATLSSIDYVPVLYWAFAGILAAYLRVTEKTIKEHRLLAISPTTTTQTPDDTTKTRSFAI